MGVRAMGGSRRGGHASGEGRMQGDRARVPRVRGGPHAREPRARAAHIGGRAARNGTAREGPTRQGEGRMQGDRARGEGARNDGRCNPGIKRRRREGCASRVRRNLGEGCCAQAERGCENEVEGSGVFPGAGKEGGCASGGGVQPGGGAARERKVARTVSTPPRPVDQLVQNPVTYLANKIEFLLLVNE